MSDLMVPDPMALDPMAPAQTDWLRHGLGISGPVAEMRRFRAAAAGAGVIPWRLDLDRMEEDWFFALAAPAAGEPPVSARGARRLARRLREAAAANHGRAVARMAWDRRCPFDLHRLLPVPAELLCLGPDDPRSLAWLRARWGVVRPLRHVRALAVPAARRGGMRLAFWSADWSPWPALAALRREWPALLFDLRPDYADG